MPEVAHRKVSDLDGWLVFTPPTEYRELSDEAVLRDLLTPDLDDRDAVVGFLNDHGMIARPVDWLLEGFGPDRPRVDRPAILTRPNGVAVSEVHWLDAAWHLRLARLLSRQFVCASEDVDVLEAWRAEALDDVLIDPGDKDLAWSHFVRLLNLGLSALAVHAETKSSLSDRPLGSPSAGLYSALCLQISNAIVDDLPVRRCANEPCGRLFVRQIGGAAHGQHRTKGVMYCSPTCAKAQSMRELRRRRRDPE